MHHLCLVSDQTMPNFLPVLNEALRPESVTLAVTSRMAAKAALLREGLKMRGIPVEELPIGNLSDLDALQGAFVDWVAAHESEDVALNVTGGTKLMAIAAQEAFRMADKPVFYVDIESDRVLWVGEPGRQPLVLTKSPSLKTAVTLCGLAIEDSQIRSSARPEWLAFADAIAEDPRKWANALGRLNLLATEAEIHGNMWGDESLGGAIPPRWEELKDLLCAHQLTAYPDTVEFLGENERLFCNGGWLEHFVFKSLKETFGLSAEQIRMNVVITAMVDGKPVHNEVDCLIFLRNSFYLLECKTSNLKRARVEGGGVVADAAIYKIAQITRQYGLRAQGAIVSARSVRAEDKRRAQLFGIKIFDNLPTLQENMRKFLRV